MARATPARERKNRRPRIRGNQAKFATAWRRMRTPASANDGRLREVVDAVATENRVMGRALGGGTIEVGVEFQDARPFLKGFARS